jgi:hypothetical protein
MFILFLLLLGALTFPPPARAYLDPGTGSYMTQVLIGMLVGGGYLVRHQFSQVVERLKKLFKKSSKKHANDETKD